MLPASRSIMDAPSIRRDGRVLAVGTNQGVVLWDLARGTELAFLPIGEAWHLMFEASGDLITSGTIGVQRWPIRLDADRGEFRIGPPRRLPLPASHCGDCRGPIGPDRGRGQPQRCASSRLPRRTFRVGPLDDCRGVAVSPDGQWLATGTHRTARRPGLAHPRRHGGGRAALRWGYRRRASAPMGNG